MSELKLPTFFPVICASFSGGADSLVMLHELHDLHERMKGSDGEFELEAVHFEHGLRGKESLDDAEFCSKVCETWGIPFTCVPLDVPHHINAGEGVEEAARRLRHSWWRDVKRNREKRKFAVALAHHADDRIETFFMRLMRGSNAGGLDALKEIREIEGVTYLRPMLKISRAEIETTAKGLEFPYRVDSTNNRNDYTRNKLRNLILPQWYQVFPAAKKGICASLEAIAEDAEALDRYANQYYQAQGVKPYCLDVKTLRELPKAVMLRVMRRFLSDVSDTEVLPDKDFINRLNEELQREDREKERILPFEGGSLRIAEGKIFSGYEEETEEADVIWDYTRQKVIRFGKTVLRAEFIDGCPEEFEQNKEAAFFDADEMPKKLVLGIRRNGENVEIFPDGECRPLKKILTDAKKSASEQKSFPMVRCPESMKIVWVPGIRRSAMAKINETTKHVLRLSVEKLVDVTAAVIIRHDGKILLCSRPAGKHLAGGWEFPGGKIEKGEAPKHCIEREIREELGMEIHAMPPIYAMEHDYETKYVRVTFFPAYSDETPCPQEHQEYQWLYPEEFEKTGLLPADRPFAEFLVKKGGKFFDFHNKWQEKNVKYSENVNYIQTGSAE